MPLFIHKRKTGVDYIALLEFKVCEIVPSIIEGPTLMYDKIDNP